MSMTTMTWTPKRVARFQISTLMLSRSPLVMMSAAPQMTALNKAATTPIKAPATTLTVTTNKT